MTNDCMYCPAVLMSLRMYLRAADSHYPRNQGERSRSIGAVRTLIRVFIMLGYAEEIVSTTGININVMVRCSYAYISMYKINVFSVCTHILCTYIVCTWMYLNVIFKYYVWRSRDFAFLSLRRSRRVDLYRCSPMQYANISVIIYLHNIYSLQNKCAYTSNSHHNIAVK
jgi:hypothetical protein